MQLNQDYFNFRFSPFESLGTGKGFVRISQHDDSVRRIVEACKARRGIVTLTGGTGMGKSTVLLELQKEFAMKDTALLIDKPPNRAQELVTDILKLLNLPSYQIDGLGLGRLLTLFEDEILSTGQKGRQIILLVDNAHTFSSEALEILRLISNLMTETRRLISIVLCGTSELNLRLQSAQMRQLRQRIYLSVSLEPLTESDTDRYIRQQLTLAGGANEVRFEKGAVQRIQRAAGGRPNLTQQLCHAALRTAELRRQRRVVKEFATAAIKELCIKTDN